jgi:hypothetical protein
MIDLRRTGSRVIISVFFARTTPARRVPFAGIAGLVVFLIALALRLPSCGDSLWVDELHTAWTIRDGFGQIASRAAIGNQTPWYFWGLWFWTRLVGDQEIWLRLPSVLAVSLASGLIAAEACKTSGSRVFGVLAGSLLAVDRNSIYFGSEARVYGLVVLASTILWISVVRLISGEAESANQRKWLLGVGICVLSLVLLHITTALTVVGILAAVLVLVSGRRKTKLRITLCTVLPMAAALGISWPNIAAVWSRRRRWDAFGATESFEDVFAMWPWTAWLAVPLTVWVLEWAVGRLLRSEQSEQSEQSERSDGRDVVPQARGVLIAWGAVVMITLVCWTTSRLEIAPIWHRRFVVAALPLAAYGGAGVWYAVLSKIRWHGLRWIGVAALVLGFASWQGTVSITAREPLNRVRRVENWRSAVTTIHRQRIESAPVLVAAELIESEWMEGTTTTADELEYLLYPVRGPYPLASGTQPLANLGTGASLAAIRSTWEDQRAAPRQLWIIARRRKASMIGFDARLRKLLAAEGEDPETLRIEMLPFGTVTVIRIEQADEFP